MSVYRIELKSDGRQIKQTFANSWTTYIISDADGNVLARYTYPNVKISGQVTYCVYCNSRIEYPLQILNSNSGLPRCGDIYVEPYFDAQGKEQLRVYDGVYFKSATPKFVGPRGSMFLWEVSYDVDGTSCEKKEKNENEQSKEETILQLSITMGVEEYASAVDVRGFPNCSTVGEFFADPLMLKYGVLSMTYKRKEYSNPLTKLMKYYKCVNNATMWGFNPGTVILDDASFSATQLCDDEGNMRSEYDVSYKFSYKRGYENAGWNITKANAGLYYMSNGVPIRALNNDGSPTDQPVLLDENGARLSSVSPTAKSSPCMLSFQIYPSEDLNELGLPDPFNV